MLCAIDTSSAISAAVGIAEPGAPGGVRILGSAHVYDPRAHAELATELVSQALREAGVARDQVTGIVAGVGPGPFTGLRVGIATAQVLALTWDVPVHGVCSLDALAADAVAAGVDGTFVAATDARRREVYWATYRGAVRVGEPQVGKASEVPLDGVDLVVGRGTLVYEFAAPTLGEPADPSASGLLRSFAAGRTTELAPMYLRKPDAQEPASR